MTEEERTLSREVEATLIPQGTPMNLAEGEKVTITHRLGGNFTVMTMNGMFRISGANADALGESVPDSIKEPTDISGEDKPLDKEELWEALKKVFDPEIPVNIVDLGLVYSLECEPHDSASESGKGQKVSMNMTLTAPGCGMGPVIADDAKMQLEGVPGVSEAVVEIVWDPPWNQDMITETGKMVLGLI